MTDKRTDLMIRHSKINNEFFGKETIMEQFEVESKITGLRNWDVPIPGTDGISVSLGVHERVPARWNYSVWRNGRDMIDAGMIDFPGLKITAEQVARVIFLLKIEYADAPTREPVKIEPTETSF